MKNFALILFLLGCVACSKRAPENQEVVAEIALPTTWVCKDLDWKVTRCDDFPRRTTCYYTGSIQGGISCVPMQVHEEN
jgi:hypothetical protein